MPKSENYHEYLKKRTNLSLFYKKYFLHPFLLKILGDTFLDVGCGLGLLLSCGSNKSIGIDINNYNIKYVRDQGLNGLLIDESNIFPLDNDSFESIIIDQVIEHLQDATTILNEINRVLKDSGKLVIGLPLEKGYEYDPDHVHFYSPEKAIEMVESKTQLKHHKTIYYPLPFKFFGKIFRQQIFYLIFHNDSSN